MLVLLIFLHQIFLSFCFYPQDLIKVVRLFSAALSVNGLTKSNRQSPSPGSDSTA